MANSIVGALIVARRVGLLTLPLHKNYGGILQAAALYEYMTSSGFEVTFLERAPKKSWKRSVATTAMQWLPSFFFFLRRRPAHIGETLTAVRKNDYISKKLSAIERTVANSTFISRFLPNRSGPLFNSDDMLGAIRNFDLDAIVVGSDQVWRPDYLPQDSISDYFLGFAEGTPTRRISYAASFGHGEWRHPSHTAEVARLLSTFSAVSVREASGVEVCREVFARGDAAHVLDPTLLVDPTFYERVAEPAAVKTGRVLFEYVLDLDRSSPTIAEDVAASLGADVSVRSLALDSGNSVLGIGGWVRAFMDADFVVTDSFHGMVFSILFRKNFLAIVNHNRGADRFTSLVGLLGLEDRLIDGASRSTLEVAARPIDYAAVSTRLDALREHSRAFLHEALWKEGD